MVALVGVTTASHSTPSAPLPEVDRTVTPVAPVLMILGLSTSIIEHVAMIAPEN